MSKLLYGGVMAMCFLAPFAYSSCAGDKALLVTGDSMVTLADQFVAVAAAMDGALDHHRVTDLQYNEWKAFGQKFQQSYPLAVHLWQVASDHKDATMQSQLTAIVLSLATDLASYAALVGVKL